MLNFLPFIASANQQSINSNYINDWFVYFIELLGCAHSMRVVLSDGGQAARQMGSNSASFPLVLMFMLVISAHPQSIHSHLLPLFISDNNNNNKPLTPHSFFLLQSLAAHIAVLIHAMPMKLNLSSYAVDMRFPPKMENILPKKNVRLDSILANAFLIFVFVLISGWYSVGMLEVYFFFFALTL